jgi:hypothetical protein
MYSIGEKVDDMIIQSYEKSQTYGMEQVVH